MTLWYSIKLINFNAFADKQEHEALNQDRDVAYNLDENEAESEMDKEAALAGIENGKKEKKIKMIFWMVSCSRYS